MKPVYYEDKRGKIRWRVVADNGKIVGSSSQGFANKTIAEENVKLLREVFSPTELLSEVNHLAGFGGEDSGYETGRDR